MESLKPKRAPIDAGYAFKPCTQMEFYERMYVIRSTHRKRIEECMVNRDGAPLGRIFLVDGDPVGFLGADNQHYLRMS